MQCIYSQKVTVRISPATAKFKPPPSLPSDFPPGSFNAATPGVDGQSVTVALPLPTGSQTKSVSAPIAAVNSNGSLGSSSVQGSSSSNSLGVSTSATSLSSNPASSVSRSLSTGTFVRAESFMDSSHMAFLERTGPVLDLAADQGSHPWLQRLNSDRHMVKLTGIWSTRNRGNIMHRQEQS